MRVEQLHLKKELHFIILFATINSSNVFYLEVQQGPGPPSSHQGYIFEHSVIYRVRH